jgi:hypothetical protein
MAAQRPYWVGKSSTDLLMVMGSPTQKIKVPEGELWIFESEQLVEEHTTTNNENLDDRTIVRRVGSSLLLL